MARTPGVFFHENSAYLCLKPGLGSMEKTSRIIFADSEANINWSSRKITLISRKVILISRKIMLISRKIIQISR